VAPRPLFPGKRPPPVKTGGPSGKTKKTPLMAISAKKAKNYGVSLWLSFKRNIYFTICFWVLTYFFYFYDLNFK